LTRSAAIETDAGQSDDQQIEHEAGIDAGAEHRHPALGGKPIDFRRRRRRPVRGIGHFFGNRDDVDAAIQQGRDLFPGVGQRRTCRLDRHVGPRALDSVVEVAADQ
jgi:hypothetical protein